MQPNQPEQGADPSCSSAMPCAVPDATVPSSGPPRPSSEANSPAPTYADQRQALSAIQPPS